MDRLRSEDGCPWDKVQTRKSLEPFIIEEAYETLDAVASNDPERMEEELGDLLFQIVFHARIGDERGEFDIDSVITKIAEKMIRRHPHIFGGDKYNTPEEVLKQWDDRKREEGKFKESVLEGIPDSLPGLMRAYKVQKRAAKVGFDWQEIGGVVDKLREEAEELNEAIKDGDKEHIASEIGDLLFTVVNIARHLKIDPEISLRDTIERFIWRFRHIEAYAKGLNLPVSDITPSEMDRLWEEAKGL